MAECTSGWVGDAKGGFGRLGSWASWVGLSESEHTFFLMHWNILLEQSTM